MIISFPFCTCYSNAQGSIGRLSKARHKLNKHSGDRVKSIPSESKRSKEGRFKGAAVDTKCIYEVNLKCDNISLAVMISGP